MFQFDRKEKSNARKYRKKKRERIPKTGKLARAKYTYSSLFVGYPERKSLWKNSGKIRRKESV
jgi:hypothetical protein